MYVLSIALLEPGKARRWWCKTWSRCGRTSIVSCVNDSRYTCNDFFQLSPFSFFRYTSPRSDSTDNRPPQHQAQFWFLLTSTIYWPLRAPFRDNIHMDDACQQDFSIHTRFMLFLCQPTAIWEPEKTSLNRHLYRDHGISAENYHISIQASHGSRLPLPHDA